MCRPALSIMLAVASLATGCGQAAASNDALASKIEGQVAAANPEFRLEQFARFYAREKDGAISALYVFAPKGYEPIVGKAGTMTWTSPERMPIVSDGGCSILNIRYDPVRETLESVACNGDA